MHQAQFAAADLAAAVRSGDEANVRAILRERPELANMQVSYGDERRPIHFAVMNRSPEFVRLLMEHGAGARHGVHPHRTATSAWTLAKERGYDEIVAIIESEEQKASSSAPDQVPPDQDPRVDEVARTAVASRDVEWLRAQHELGLLTNTVRWDAGGLLTVAVQHGHLDVLRMLLDFGFDPDEPVSEGDGRWTARSQGYPLWRSAAEGRLQMAELLLSRGANPNVHVDSSGSAVYSAYSHGQWEMVELLRRHGGIVTADIAAIYRETDVARALLKKDVSVVKDLLRHGASGGATEIVRMALEHIDWQPYDVRWFRPLTEPLSYWHHIPWLYAGNKDFDQASYLDCFRLILKRSGPNVIGGFNRTALHEVAAMGSWIDGQEAAAFAIELLTAGANTDVRDDLLESTPLGWACRWGREKVVEVLLRFGADREEPEAQRWATPKAWASKMGHGGVLALLLEPPR